MIYWNAFLILNEIKKSIDKFWRVWAKRWLSFEIFEKILTLRAKIETEEWCFIHCLSDFPGPLSF